MTGLLEIAQTILFGIISGAIVAAAGWLLRRLFLAKPKKSSHKLDHEPSRLDDGRRRGRYALSVGCVGLLAFALWADWLGPLYSNRLIHSNIEILIRKPRWIAYEPLGFNPSDSSNPDVELISQELGWIQQAGFDGIITFTSQGTFAKIPALAKEKHLAVIMGVWNPMDRQEIAAAISQQQFVDAYCVGHDGLNYDYSYDALIKAVNHVRFHTGRPVTTTEKIDHYFNDERLLTVGDWLFPDCLLPVRDDAAHLYVADAKRDAAKTMELANQLALKVAQRDRKPILLKMVGYPYPLNMDCVLGAESDEQVKFFSLLTDSQRDVGTNLSTDVSISVYSAFDLAWKTGRDFYPWEKCTGLLNGDGSPRPAVQEIMKRRIR